MIKYEGKIKQDALRFMSIDIREKLQGFQITDSLSLIIKKAGILVDSPHAGNPQLYQVITKKIGDDGQPFTMLLTKDNLVFEKEYYDYEHTAGDEPITRYDDSNIWQKLVRDIVNNFTVYDRFTDYTIPNLNTVGIDSILSNIFTKNALDYSFLLYKSMFGSVPNLDTLLNQKIYGYVIDINQTCKLDRETWGEVIGSKAMTVKDSQILFRKGDRIYTRMPILHLNKEVTADAVYDKAVVYTNTAKYPLYSEQYNSYLLGIDLIDVQGAYSNLNRMFVKIEDILNLKLLHSNVGVIFVNSKLNNFIQI